jgi:Ca2+-transporting ATPase
VKGRARYKIKELYQSQSLKKYLERSLINYPEITYVSANVLTSNILVKFSQDISYEKVGVLIRKTLFDYQHQTDLIPEDKFIKIPTKDYQQKLENWHLMTVEEALKTLNTTKISGLSEKTAAKNLNLYGKNLLSGTVTRSVIRMIIEQFQSLPVG